MILEVALKQSTGLAYCHDANEGDGKASRNEREFVIGFVGHAEGGAIKRTKCVPVG
jgi:hypothetical protein